MVGGPERQETVKEDAPTVLVIEDDRAVLRTIERTLMNANLRLELFDHPAEALSFAKEARHIDLLITDVMLPTMTGFQLVPPIRTKHPGIRIIFISGYPSDAWVATDYPPNSVFLAKPFMPAELLSAVDQQLAR